MLHKDAVPGDIHVIHQWAVADATALAALSLASGDIGKIAWQQDTDEYKVLKNNTGPVWIPLNPALLAAVSVSIADAGSYYTGTTAEAALQEIGLALATLSVYDVALDGRLDTLEAKTYPYDIPIACGDESTAITTGVKVAWRAIRAFSLEAVSGSLTTAQSAGSILTIDIKKNGTSIFTTLLTFDNTEKTTATAAVAAVLSSTPLAVAAGDEITFEVTQAGIGGAGLKIGLKGSTS